MLAAFHISQVSSLSCPIHSIPTWRIVRNECVCWRKVCASVSEILSRNCWQNLNVCHCFQANAILLASVLCCFISVIWYLLNMSGQKCSYQNSAQKCSYQNSAQKLNFYFNISMKIFDLKISCQCEVGVL